MVDAGRVPPNPELPVPSAVYTGTAIDARSVLQGSVPDVAIVNTATTQSENSVFVHPHDPSRVLNSNNSTPYPVTGLYGTSGFMTRDGGVTWPGSVQGTGGINSGDPAAVIDLSGRYYVNYIAADGGNGTAWSGDDGATWTHVQVAPNPGQLADKNHLWVDNVPDSPHEGNLYAAWTAFGGVNDGNIVVTRSTDGGLTWSSGINVSGNLPGFQQGVSIQVGPDGTVYAFYTVYVTGGVQDEPAYGVSISTDGGATWGAGRVVIQNTRGIRVSETSKNHRVNSFPVAAVDISGGARNGWIYMVWANIGVPGVNQGPGIDIYMIRSTDNAVSWSAPVKVNQDPSGQGHENYFPWLTCDPVTGALSVIFYSDRNVSSTQCEAFVANSIDGGATWEDFKVSDVAFTPTPIPGLASGYMGDYLGIAARAGTVYPVWTDNRTGNCLAWTNPYTLADLSDPDTPETVRAYSDFLTPASIDLNWIDPTTYVNGDTLLPANFTIEIERDGVSIASVAAGTERYTDNGLVDGQRYEYSLFTRDTVDSLSLPVSVSWTAGGSPVPHPPTTFFVTEFDSVQLQMNWTNPSANIDGTPMDDFAGINLYENGNLVATFTRTTGDTGTADSAVFTPASGTNHYYVTAIDNESPINESVASDVRFSPIRLPFYDDFPVPGDPDPEFWVNSTATVDTLGLDPPSGAGVLDMDGMPDGGETIALFPIDLSDHRGDGLVLSFWYQPQGTGNAPEAGDSLVVEFLDDRGRWRTVRSWPGTGVVPFANAVIGIDDADPGAGATFFHPRFQFRFRNIATASSTSSFDNWLIDDVFMGIPTANPIMVVSPSSLVDTTLENAIVRTGFVVANANAAPSTLTYTVHEPAGAAWITATPGGGMLASGAMDTITVDLDATGLAPGTHAGEIIITGDDPANTADTVAVSLTVEAAPVVKVSPTEMAFVLDSAETDATVMTIANNGGGTLAYRLRVTAADPMVARKPAVRLIHSARVDEAFFSPELHAAIARRTGTPRPTPDLDGVALSGESVPDGGSATGEPPEVIDGEEIFGGTDSPFTGGSRDRGNVFRVDAARRLVEYRAYLNIPISIPIYFAVYEGATLQGTYTRVAETYHANSGTGMGFYSSGPLNVALEAGKYYYLCASWGDAPVTYYRGGPATPLPASFGELETGISALSAGFPPRETIDQTTATGTFTAYFCAVVTETPVTWLNVVPDSGVVEAGGSAAVTVRASGDGLSPGIYGAEVVVESNDPLAPAVTVPVGLTVRGDTVIVTRTIAVHPDTLAFPSDVQVGDTARQSLWVANLGTDTLRVSDIVSDDGAVTASPNAFLLAGGDSLAVTVSWVPTLPGNLNATLTLASNADNDSSLAIPVYGGALPPPPIVAVSPESLAFVLDSAGVDSAALRITNSGGSPLAYRVRIAASPTAAVDAVTGVRGDAKRSAEGAFDFSPVTWLSVVPDSGVVEAGGSAAVTVRASGDGLSPGVYGAEVVVESNDPLAPAVTVPVGLTVRGDTVIVTRTIAVHPDTLAFPADVQVGDTARQSLWVANLGTDTLRVWEIVSDDGAVTASPSVFLLAGGDSLAVTVSYAPVTAGLLSATLTLASNADNDSSLAIPVYGGAVPPPPIVAVHPDSLTFPSDVQVGDTARQSLRVANLGTDTLRVWEIVSDDGAVTASPNAFLLAGGDSLAVTVSYAPVTAGLLSATLTLASNADNDSSLAIPVYGVAVPPPPIVVVSPESLAFSLLPGDSVDQVLGIVNAADSGAATLHWSAALVDSLGQSPAGERVGNVALQHPARPERKTANPVHAGGLRPARLSLSDGRASSGWVTLVGATSGSVAPGATMDLTVRAYGLGGPDTTYSRMVEVSSNDPATPSVRVPVTVTVRDSMTSIAFDGPLPTTFAVSQNYPNPFNPTTTIAYQVPGQSMVRLAVYNVLGQRIRLLVDAVAQPGRYRVTWDGRNDAGARVGSGVYIYRFEAGDYHKVQKMILMK